jgi:L-fuculose-phosphate aldolase
MTRSAPGEAVGHQIAANPSEGAQQSDAAQRAAMVAICRSMNAAGLNQGTSGNLSVRAGAECMLITPSGLAYEAMQPGDIAELGFDGRWRGPRRPSSEWRFHRDILRSRPDVGAVLHTHSTYCTTLACLREGIPAFHYMVAVAGGADIRCGRYATFGTQELSVAALEALEGRRACLLANHGLIALGDTPERALSLAVEVEALAHMYLLARQTGSPVLLDAAEMARVLELFRTYGTPAFPDDTLKQVGT